jgi:hypothetical protein
LLCVVPDGLAKRHGEARILAANDDEIGHARKFASPEATRQQTGAGVATNGSVGKVYCWGDNLWGQVGGTTAEGCWIASLDSQTKDFCAWQPTEVAGISDAVGRARAFSTQP